MKPGQTLRELMDIRCPLYEACAHRTIDVEHLEIRQIVEKITALHKDG